VGDLVTPIFSQKHYGGLYTAEGIASGLGGAIDGMFREYAVVPAASIVRSPKNWSAREASTLPCAALTAWNCLYGLKPLQKGQNVLVLGTGGVSIFALQFAKKAGAFVVATTSSKEKARKLRELGADGVVNYVDTPEWGEAAKKLTPGGRGFDIIVEVVGDFAESLKAVALEGVVHVVGWRGGAGAGEPSLMTFFTHLCTIRPVFIGSRAQHEDMVRHIDEWGLKPVLEGGAGWEDAGKAFDEFYKGKHFGEFSGPNFGCWY
jgi:NADPH:quinone reductase-like Zn-dependent oxidoreductase